MIGDIKISIITVCRNAGKNILKCISSVSEQDYSNIEYLIIDGASTDNTLEIINSCKEKISKVISESDNGIYDAMNKGIENSTGDYILFLNADDYFISSTTISNVVKIIEGTPRNTDIFYGRVIIFNFENNQGHIWKTAPVSKYSLFRGSIPHPATIYARKSFETVGLFDTSYKIAGDYEWVVRAYVKHNLFFKQMDAVISVFLKGGISTDRKHKSLSRKEIDRIRDDYFSSLERLYYRFRWFLRKNFKFR